MVVMIVSNPLRSLSFVRLSLASLQHCIANAKTRVMAWMPIPQAAMSGRVRIEALQFAVGLLLAGVQH